MSHPTKITRLKRPIILTAASALVVMAFAIAPLANAHDTAKPVTKTTPAAPMDQSKMAGMHDTQGMKPMNDMNDMQGMNHMDGSKHMNGMSMTGDVDYDFAFNMRMHHQMAVDMSQAQLKNGKSPKLRAMATNIIAAQKKEIAILDAWLAATKKPATKSMPTK